MPSTECYLTRKLYQKSIKEKAKAATPIRNKCLMDCKVGGVLSTILPDTGCAEVHF